MSDPKTTKDDKATGESGELDAEELEQVNGGTALLLPAVQADLVAGDGSVHKAADGDVDGRDFLIWQRGYGTPTAKK